MANYPQPIRIRGQHSLHDDDYDNDDEYFQPEELTELEALQGDHFELLLERNDLRSECHRLQNECHRLRDIIRRLENPCDADQLSRLKEEASELRRKGRIVVAERDRLELLVAELRRELARPRSDPQEIKFAHAKREFAKRYHPHGAVGSGQLSRSDVFQEFWDVLERIERGEL